jgi:hypothetical protein
MPAANPLSSGGCRNYGLRQHGNEAFRPIRSGRIHIEGKSEYSLLLPPYESGPVLRTRAPWLGESDEDEYAKRITNAGQLSLMSHKNTEYGRLLT